MVLAGAQRDAPLLEMRRRGSHNQEREGGFLWIQQPSLRRPGLRGCGGYAVTFPVLVSTSTKYSTVTVNTVTVNTVQWVSTCGLITGLPGCVHCPT
jgi:hypothetical protein